MPETSRTAHRLAALLAAALSAWPAARLPAAATAREAKAMDPNLPAAERLGRPGPARLPGVAVPTAYDLTLTVDPRRPAFEGEVTIHLDVKAPTSAIHVHAMELTLEPPTLEAGGRTWTGQVSEASGEGAEPDRGEKVVAFPAEIPSGPARLTLRFEAPFNEQLSGLYRAKDREERWYAYTQFETADARRAFPCMDEPRFKVPFRVTLVVPEGMSAAANTPEASRELRDGRLRVRFTESPPLPTYLLAFVVGDLDVVEGPKGRLPVRGLAARGKGAMLGGALGMHAELVEVMEAYFGRPFPYEKLDAAALLEYAAGAMENAGLITYREEFLLVDPATTSKRRLRTIGAIAAHEIAHQWFGDLVTPAWWDEIWLNESFASWMGAKAVDAWRPEYEERKDLLADRVRAFRQDVLAAARPVRRPVRNLLEAETAFDSLTYTKGANILAMMEDWLGEGAFRAGVRRYLDEHAWGIATSEDFFAALEAASGRDVRAVATSYLDRAGVPIVSLDLDCASGRPPAALLAQSRYRPLGSAAPAGFPEGGPWRIPVCLAYPAGDAVARTCTLLAAERARVALEGTSGCPSWVHPNAGEHGYYHWSVPPETLRALGPATRAAWSVAGAPGPAWGKTASERSRLVLLQQTGAMVAAGKIDPGTRMALIEEMVRGADRLVLEEILESLESIVSVWEDVRDQESFRDFVRRVLEPEARRLAWDPKPGESEDDALLRPAILSALGTHGRAAWVLQGAASRAATYMEDPASVPPELAGPSLALAAAEGKVSFDRLADLLSRARTPAGRTNALNALAALPPGEPLGKALGLVLTDAVRAQDTFAILFGAFNRPESRTEAFAFFREHFDAIVGRMPSFGIKERMPRLVGDFCTPEENGAARAFFEAKAIPRSEIFLAQGIEEADQCIALRAFGKDSIAAYLSRPAPAAE